MATKLGGVMLREFILHILPSSKPSVLGLKGGLSYLPQRM